MSPYGGSESAPGPVTILGSGFTGATEVTFGGVPATSFTVDSPYEITATPPAYSSRPTCAPSVPGRDARPTTSARSRSRSRTRKARARPAQILPPLEGAMPSSTRWACSVAPPGCGCETAAAPTEYDYVPDADDHLGLDLVRGPAPWPARTAAR